MAGALQTLDMRFCSPSKYSVSTVYSVRQTFGAASPILDGFLLHTRRAIYLVEGPHLSDHNPQNRRKIREMSAKMVARRAVKLSVIVGL
jgi:hypothetical protein